jgi:hypothetical protein
MSRRRIAAFSRLLKRTDMPIALSAVEGCAQSSRSNVKMGIASLQPSYNLGPEGMGSLS